jgi:H+/Cl- antiporter ClcA
MENFVGLFEMLKTPVLWTGIILCALCGIVGLISPRLLQTANDLSTKWVDTNWLFSCMDRTINVDATLVNHARAFGFCCLVASVGLFYKFG